MYRPTSKTGIPKEMWWNLSIYEKDAMRANYAETKCVAPEQVCWRERKTKVPGGRAFHLAIIPKKKSQK